MPPSEGAGAGGAPAPGPGRWPAAAWLVVAGAALAAPPARAEPLLRPSELASDAYAETFTFVADLDDGTYLQLQLAVTNLGPGAGTGLCRALVKRPGAAAWTGLQRYGRRGWSHGAGPDGEALVMGGCSARSGQGTRIQVALGDRALELTFPEPLSERAPPTTIRAEGREYRSTILQAFTPVTARLVGFGAEALLAGGGYADHSRSTFAPAALAQRWIRFRALRAPSPVLVLARQAADGGWGPAWSWRPGQAPRPLDGVDLRPVTGAVGGWEVTLRDGSAVATVGSLERLHRHDPLEALGLVGRVVGTVMTVPVTSTFRAILRAPVPVEGILEVSAPGEE